MREKMIKYILFVAMILFLKENVYADCPEVVVRGEWNLGCGRGLSGIYASCNNSLLPSAKDYSTCCDDDETNRGKGGLSKCTGCGATPCRLCRHDMGSGSSNARYGIKEGENTIFRSWEYVAIPESRIDGFTVYETFHCDNPFQYADTEYSVEKDDVCRLYQCEPVPLKVCWVREQRGTNEYNWSDTRPGGSEWQANFNLTKEECLGIITQDVPKYCFVKYGTNTSNNEYKVESSATNEWQKVNENEYGSEECNSDLICKECDEEPKCYKNNQDKLVWGKYRNREGYTLQSDKNRDECNSVVICDPSLKPISGNSESAQKCEDKNVTKTYETGISCDGDYGKGFYKIECKTEVKPTFDLGNDGIKSDKKLILYQGQGFGFGIKLKIIKKCVGTFNKEVWDKAYNQYNTTASNTEDQIRNENIVKKLEEKVDEFNKWDFNDKIEIPNIELKLETNPSVTISKMSYKIENNGVTKRKETGNITLASGKVAKNFIYTNEENSSDAVLKDAKPMIIEYFPPQVYLDKITGEITNSKDVNAINGGNKVYVGLNAEVGENFPINITISNFEDGKTIKNEEKCLISIKKPTSLYRIIDVNNPFVNNTRQKPQNWVNEKRDYSTIINGNTQKGRDRIEAYKRNPLYVFDLSGSEISEIKNSNKEIENNYLGTCSDEKKDIITEKICSIINKK